MQLPSVFDSLTEDYLYHFVSQEEIFMKYLGIPIELNRKIVSPLRKDNRPTATFGYKKNGILIFTDWNGEFSGNCVHLVMHIFNVKYHKAIRKIASDFNLLGKALPLDAETKIQKNKQPKIKQFSAVWSELETPHISYFKSFGISPETLKYYNVHKLKALWMNGELLYLTAPNDLGVIYLEKDWFKAYLFNRKTYRFYSHGNGIQGLQQLKFNSNILIIQKSLKDVMLMHELGYESIAPPSENTYITDLQIRMLQDRYSEIVVIMDNDPAGLKALEHYKALGLRTLLIPDKKDTTDYCKAYGIRKTETLLNNLIQCTQLTS